MIIYYLELDNEDDLQLPYNYLYFDRVDDARSESDGSKIEDCSFYKPIIKLD